MDTHSVFLQMLLYKPWNGILVYNAAVNGHLSWPGLDRHRSSQILVDHTHVVTATNSNFYLLPFPYPYAWLGKNSTLNTCFKVSVVLNFAPQIGHVMLL